MIATAKPIDLEISRFETIDLDEARLIEGGMDPLTVAGAVVAIGAGLATIFAISYQVGKDVAEEGNEDCECPEAAPARG